MARPAVSVKLLINKQTNRVLFAEAGKDFVDFLFCILSMPLAKVINLVGKQDTVGSLANLYESVENLDENYMQPNQPKNTILEPDSLVTNAGSFVPLLAIQAEPVEKFVYRCRYCNYSIDVSDSFSGNCYNCHEIMRRVKCTAPAKGQQVSGEGGYVKGVVTYMVMDDLVVKPMSTISSITLLNKFNVEDVRTLEEKVVDFGMDEALKLLKASMETKTVLTSVFLQATN